MVLDTQDDTTVAKRDRVTNVSVVILCRVCQALLMGAVALFLPLIRRDLGLSFTQGGALSALTILTYALMQVPAGFMTDRFGPKRLFFMGVLGTTVLFFTFGLVQEYWQALVNQSLAGIFRAFLFVPGLALLSGWFPSRLRSTAMSLSLIGGLVGTVVLDIVGPLLVAEHGWRFPFLSFASVGIVASFILLRFGKDPPSGREQQKVSVREILQLFRHRVMWVCGFLQYIRLAIVQGTAFWLPSLLIDEKGLSLQLTGLLIALRAGLMAPSSVVGGYISDRLKNPALVIGFALTVLAITSSQFVATNNLTALIVLIGINAIFVQMYFGPLFSVPMEMLGTRTAGISRGVSNLFANIGSFSFVYLMGVLKDATGSFEAGFYTIAGVCVIGAVLSIVLARIRHKAIVSTG
ncbi:nitrate/nitrite transporter [Chloroflexota bacterium]